MGKNNREKKATKQRIKGIRSEMQSVGTREKRVIESNQMTAHSDSNWLPMEIVTEILSRLPPEPLLRFRSVCKSWRDLIDSHDFIHNLHLPRSRASSPTKLLYQQMNNFFYFDYESPASTSKKIRLPFPIGDRDVSLTSCRDGLLCLSALNTCQLLWCPDPESVGGRGGVYKVLFVSWEIEGPVLSLVCTLRGMDLAWRRIPNSFTTWDNDYGELKESPCVNGAVHRVHRYLREDLECGIAAFDVLQERFTEIGFPPGCCSPEKKCWSVSRYLPHVPRVAELRGFLALFHMDGSGTLMETWLLTDYYGVVWTKDHTICLTVLYKELHLDMRNRGPKEGLQVYPVVKISDEELVMRIYALVPPPPTSSSSCCCSSAGCCSSARFFTYEFFSYDPVLKNTTILSGIANINGLYVESLVSPCETTTKKENKKKKNKRRKVKASFSGFTLPYWLQQTAEFRTSNSISLHHIMFKITPYYIGLISKTLPRGQSTTTTATGAYHHHRMAKATPAMDPEPAVYEDSIDSSLRSEPYRWEDAPPTAGGKLRLLSLNLAVELKL
ncbi:F-box protein [Nymphaea thermarum]|nr:F-box protein [Nymphaea thermarum]